MKNKFIAITCVLLLINAVSLKAQYNTDNLTLTQKGAGYKNLALYPVRANTAFFDSHRHVGQYVPLKEGLEKGKVRISEAGGRRSGGEVNNLSIENISSDTIILLAGEVVQGGKQDRMVAQDVILYPKSGKKDLSVYCVEQGRWQPKGDGADFKEYYAISPNKVRKAGAVAKSQNEVWDEVAVNTTKNRAASITGTLTALAHADTLNASLNAYFVHYGEMFRQDNDVIGVVAVSGNVILGCDLFATHELFVSHYTNLLSSYAAEAITSGGPANVSFDRIKQYLEVITGNEKDQEKKVSERGMILKEGEKKIHISTF